jgi:hypothetical protein
VANKPQKHAIAHAGVWLKGEIVELAPDRFGQRSPPA